MSAPAIAKDFDMRYNAFYARATLVKRLFEKWDSTTTTTDDEMTSSLKMMDSLEREMSFLLHKKTMLVTEYTMLPTDAQKLVTTLR